MCLCVYFLCSGASGSHAQGIRPPDGKSETARRPHDLALLLLGVAAAFLPASRSRKHTRPSRATAALGARRPAGPSVCTQRQSSSAEARRHEARPVFDH